MHPVGIGDRLRQPVLQQRAVRQAGQRIMVGQMLQLQLDLLAARDVLDHGAEIFRIAVFVAHQRVGQIDPDVVTVLVQIALFARFLVDFARQHAPS